MNIKYFLLGGGKPQWTVLHHNGPMFPPEYIPHNVPIIVNNKEVILSKEAEEFATAYAKYINTDYCKSNTFKKNFWKDFKKLVGNNINSLDEIDFSLIEKHLIVEKDKKKLVTKEQKERIKKEQDTIDEPYKFCIIDGIQQQVGNFKIEPPGIFLGRGNHPLSGHIKKRLYPEDIIINLSKDAKIPTPNIPGHKWGEVIHDNSVIWLASWKENITGKNKYVFTSLDSFFKSKSDESKFDLARKLKKNINKIREDYGKQLLSDNMKNKQLATALYFIDNLALRVGGMKDTKEAADTVGVTSLRVEHINLLDDNYIKLDFLGKDSIRYCKKVQVTDLIYKNLQDFVKNKNRKDDLFDLITSSALNEYLNSIMEGLTAKVWRTYNASTLFQKEIDKVKDEKLSEFTPGDRLNYLLAMFNQANAEVALLCNHQKNVNKSLDSTLDKINDRIKELKAKKRKAKDKDKIKTIKAKILSLKQKKETKIKLKDVSLGTSKDNYIDPRIIFAYIKKFNIPPIEILKEKAQKRFEWASKYDDYRF